MVDDMEEERKEKKGFAKIKKIAGGLEKDHKGFKEGGPTTGDRLKYGKNMSRIVNQTGKKTSRGR